MTDAGDTSSISVARLDPADSPVERAFRLLQLVIAAGEPVGVRELARRSALPRSTVGRLTGQLESLGMIARTTDAGIVPGPGLATLRPDASEESLLPARFNPLLAELVEAFGENAALSVDGGPHLRYLSQASADHAVSVPDVSGEEHHFHLVAPGLVTMAWWPADRLDRELEQPLEATTTHSMIDAELLRARLVAIRRDGWCWTDQELDAGVNGLAVPVLVGDEVIATVSLFGPAYRFNPGDCPGAADRLSDQVERFAATALA